MKTENSIPRIVPPFYMLASIIIMVALNAYAPIGQWLNPPWKYIGIAVIGLAFLLIIGSFILFRKAGTEPRPGVRANALVTSGTFRYTRNPMYIGMTTILIGVATLLGSYSPFIVIPVFVWIIQSQFIKREEKWMEEWFGQSYLDYKKKTPRWLF